MSYPGNTTLGQETQQRLLATFEQTLDLVQRGNTQEALLGCDFILRMDPQFEPARKLLDRINAGDESLGIDDLRSSSGAIRAVSPPPGRETVALPLLEELSFADLSDFGSADLSAQQRPAAVATATAASLRSEMSEALAARRFADVVAAAERQPGLLASAPDLAQIAEQAQARVEAEPYVRKFLTAARDAARAGQTAEAERALRKASALDGGHPEIPVIAALLAAPAQAPIPPTPTFDAPDWGELPPLPDAPMSLEGFPADPISLTAEPMAGASGSGSESDRRIAELLAEGDAAFARGEHQAAIDAWSRIFLIDIDHELASRKIEEARGLKAEAERKVEEIFHEAVMHVDAGQSDEAKAALVRVLQIQPNYLAARELLDQLNVPGGVREARARTTTVPLATAVGSTLLKEEILVPPEPGTVVVATHSPVAAGSPRKRFLMIGGGVLVLAALGGYLLWSQRARLFPNSTPPAMAPAAADPVARATKLHEQGKTAVAVAQLRRLPPEDPQYQRAQELVAEWEKLIVPAAPAGPPPEQLARREGLLAEAHKAATAGEQLRARSLYDQAAAILELPAEAAAERAAAELALEPIKAQLDLFRQGDYEFAISDLWKRHEAEPTNRDVTRLLVDGYYNLGVRALQRDAPREAAGHFKETVALASGDAELARLLRFSEAYSDRPLDLLYRTFSKYLPLREL